ncbi:MAG: MYG1 family protein [bacterium]|nr:MYG1 family protein [bacterium]
MKNSISEIVTHNSRFHTDDVFAVAALTLLLGEVRVIRTREPSAFADADYVVDVGNLYDPGARRFDHHQEGGAGARQNGVPYASFGLVWKTYGKEIAGSEAVFEKIDQKLVQPIDAMDNGIDILMPKNAVSPYLIQDITFAFGSSWKEKDRDIDAAFMEMVGLAKKILEREIIRSRDEIEATTYVEEAYRRADDKRVVVLEDAYPYDALVSHHEVLYVVRPNIQSANWKVEAVSAGLRTYAVRKPLPAEWAGKRDEDLAALTGVADALFCHNGRFLAVAGSKAGALSLAKLALGAPLGGEASK